MQSLPSLRIQAKGKGIGSNQALTKTTFLYAFARAKGLRQKVTMINTNYIGVKKNVDISLD